MKKPPPPADPAKADAPIGHKRRVFGLTPAQKKFADIYIATVGDRITAVAKAYPNTKPSLRPQVAYARLTNEHIHRYITQHLIVRGGHHKAVNKLLAKLESKRPFNAQEGTIEVDDNAAQIAAADKIIKILGGYAPQQHEISRSKSGDMSAEDPIVLRWIFENGRLPSKDERQRLLSPPIDVEPTE